MRRSALSAAIALLAVPAAAQTAVDGDTLRLGATANGLYGIDAPELKQTCGDWPAGDLSAEGLAAMTIGREVTCAVRAATVMAAR